MRPKRIQRQRTKGWRMPPNTVYVGRPTKWGNPYPVECFRGGMIQVVNLFARFLKETPIGRELAADALEQLRGKDLACWCPLNQPCHAEPENDTHILWACTAPLLASIIAAWGTNKFAQARARRVMTLIRGGARRQVQCFRKNPSGQPFHPLYLSYSLPMVTL